MMNILNRSDQYWIIEQMYKTINMMATDLTSSDLDCYYCLHYPEGGNGQCTFHQNGDCQFKWRYADQTEALIAKIRSELNENAG